jgi:Rrf2 family protein
MLQITRKADYAVRLVMEVAANSGGHVTTAQVARREDIPYQFLRKVAHTLVGSGILAGEKGGKGGLALARPADEITVLDVLRAIDVLAVNDCTVSPESCARRSICAAYPFWFEAQREMERVLANTPISRIARAHLALQTRGGRSSSNLDPISPVEMVRTAPEIRTVSRLESERQGPY